VLRDSASAEDTSHSTVHVYTHCIQLLDDVILARNALFESTSSIDTQSVLECIGVS
jgi:hypothetical protein